jgi:prophage regulatory protein
VETAGEGMPMDPVHAATPQPIRFLRLREVLAICGKSRSSIYEAIRKGKFPKPVKLGANSSAWINSEIDEWMRSCIEASRQE